MRKRTFNKQEVPSWNVNLNPYDPVARRKIQWVVTTVAIFSRSLVLVTFIPFD